MTCRRLFVFVALVLASVPGSLPIAVESVAHEVRGLTLLPTAFQAGRYLIEGDRGWLAVRENRDNPDSPMIELAFARFRHPQGGEAAPIVYLPGGPGQPVMDHIEDFAATYKNYLNLGGGGDMLVLEQRGIGASRPRLDCPGLLARPGDQPLSAEIMGKTHKRYIKDCLDHWTEQGLDPGGYDVESMADDVDEIRAALGYERIALVGESFGAHHALTFIKRHGERVERAALSAVIGPDHMFEMPATVEQQLVQAGEGDGAAMTRTLESLEEPVSVRAPDEAGGADLEIGRYDLALASVTFSRQTAFLQQLPRLYQMVAAGDLSWLAGWSSKIRSGYPSNLASLLITCASGASAERRAAITEEAKASLIGDAVDLLGADACAPVADLELGPAFRSPINADMPVLMISGELDPRAPPANAEALLPGLSRGHHVVFPGVSHDFGEARDAQLELTYRFLARGETTPNKTLLP